MRFTNQKAVIGQVWFALRELRTQDEDQVSS
jgi:hypothetical protein